VGNHAVGAGAVGLIIEAHFRAVAKLTVAADGHRVGNLRATVENAGLIRAERKIGRTVAVVEALDAAVMSFVAIADLRAGCPSLTITVDFANAESPPVAAEAGGRSAGSAPSLFVASLLPVAILAIIAFIVEIALNASAKDIAACFQFANAPTGALCVARTSAANIASRGTALDGAGHWRAVLA